jgi:hypothetical protein
MPVGGVVLAGDKKKTRFASDSATRAGIRSHLIVWRNSAVRIVLRVTGKTWVKVFGRERDPLIA